MKKILILFPFFLILSCSGTFKISENDKRYLMDINDIQTNNKFKNYKQLKQNDKKILNFYKISVFSTLVINYNFGISKDSDND